jgi:hypothetical protein
MSSLASPQPFRQGEMLPVEFHGDTIDAVFHNGRVWVSLRRLCESLGIDADSQRVKLREKPWARTVIITVRDANGRQQQTFCIDLDTLPMWLATIDVGRVAEDVRGKLTAYQCEAADALRRYFFEGQATNPRSQRRLRYERQGKDQLWIEDREQSVTVRKDFTSTLKAHGVAGTGYGMVTNAIYMPILGGGAQQLRERMGLTKSANLRDNLPRKELLMVSLSEIVSQERIEEQNCQGNRPCQHAASTAAIAIAGAVRGIPKS